MKFRIKNNENSRDIYIAGDIRDDSWKGWDWEDDINTYPSDIKNLLNESDNKNVNVYINSGGGDLFAGMAISNMLSRYKGKTKAVIDGLAASSASIIAFGCDEIEIPSNAYLMIHKPSVSLYGNSDDLLKWADTLDELQKGIVNTYMRKTQENITEETINSLVDKETWLTGETAKEFFNVKVIEKVELTNCVGTCVMDYKKTPDVFKEVDDRATENEKLKKEIEIALAIN